MASKWFPQDLISSDGELVSPKTEQEALHYGDMGYRAATTNEIRKDDVRKVYDNWQGQVTAFGRGITDMIPGFNAAIVGVSQALNSQRGTDWAQEGQDVADANPMSHGAGMLAGGGAMGAAIGGGGAAMATSAGVSPVLGEMAVGAATNAALGGANIVDRAALAHAMEPHGEEKILANMGPELLWDAALGAGIPLAGAAVARLGSKMGGMFDAFSDSQLQKQLIDSKQYEVLQAQGRASPIGSMLDSYDLHGLTGSEAIAKINPKLAELGQSYNEAKGLLSDVKMSAQDSGGLVDQLGTKLGTSHPELADEVVATMAKADNAPTIDDLHNLRMKLDSKINWDTTDEATILAQQPVVDARETVGNFLRKTVREYDSATGGAMADRWSALDKDFSNLSLLKSALNKDGARGLKSYLKGSAAPDLNWQTVMLSNTVPFGKTMLAAYKGAQAMSGAFENGVFAEPAKAFAQVFNNSAERLTQATTAGLTNSVAITTKLMHDTAKSDEHYDMAAAKIRQGMKSPEEYMGNLGTSLAQGGMPDAMTQNLAMRTQAMQQFLYNIMPKNPTPGFQSGMPSTFRPSHDMRRKWLGVYNTLNDPSYGILNPTKDNIGALKQFYPETLSSVQEAITSQIQTNKALPLEAQTWASRIMSYPVSNLTSPSFYTVLQGARQYNAAKSQQDEQAMKQQASGGSAGGKSGGNMSNSQDMTSVQKLQNRNS